MLYPTPLSIRFCETVQYQGMPSPDTGKKLTASLAMDLGTCYITERKVNMTDKDILKEIKGADKIKPYAVDDEAIRRGKANLALMMTLTTADHYDWFIGKFTSHNYFDFQGYRVSRRNVSKPPKSIPRLSIISGLKRNESRKTESKNPVIYFVSKR